MTFPWLLMVVSVCAADQPKGDGKQWDRIAREILSQADQTYKRYNDSSVQGVLEQGTRGTRFSIDYSGRGAQQWYQFSRIEEIDGEKSYLDRLILAASPTQHYVCRRQAPDASYYIESRDASRSYYFHLTRERQLTVMSPCYVGPFALRKLVESPFLQIDGIEDITRVEHSLVEIRFHVDISQDEISRLVETNRAAVESGVWSEDLLMRKGPTSPASGWMLLEPKYGYIVHESEVDAVVSLSGDKRLHKSRVEYDYSGSFPVVRMAFVHNAVDTIFTCNTFEPVAKPESFFSLATVGLSDQPTPRRTLSPAYYALAAVLAASLAGLIYVFLRARSQRKGKVSKVSLTH